MTITAKGYNVSYMLKNHNFIMIPKIYLVTLGELYSIEYYLSCMIHTNRYRSGNASL